MTTILTKRSNTPGAVPVTANLTNAAGGAELAVNTADKRLFTLNSANNVVEVGTNPSSLTCADVSATVLRAGSGTITNLIATTAAITDFSATVARVGSLTISSLSLSNATVTSATITTLTGTSAGITTISSDSANITQLQSTSATITTLTSTSASVTNLTATSLVLSNLSIASANVTTLTSASATITNLINTSASITTITNSPTFSAGTANGVLYLNGSKVATSGSALVFDGTNFGVGTASPTFKLQVVGNQRIQKDTAGYEAAMLSFSTLTETGAIYRMGMATGGVFAIGRSDTSTTNLTLDSSGNFGIGTASPAQRLDVTGAVNSVQARFGNVAGRGLTIGTTTNSGTNDAAVVFNAPTTEGAFFFQTVSDTKMTLTTAGNLGIGTASPAYKLDVRGVAASGNGTITTGFSWDTRGLVGTFSNHALGFITNGASPTMLLDTSGNLGIGTASPSYKLHVAATANDAGLFTSTATTTALRLDNTNANGWGSNLAIYTGGTAAGYFGTIGSLLGNTTQDLAVYANTGNGFRVYTNGNNFRAIFDSSGNLGLGVTPTSAWDSGFKVIQLGGGAYFGQYNNNAVQVGLNTYFNGTNYIYTTTNEASRFAQTDGQFQWFTAPSGTAGNPITFTQAMTLDADGRLALGATGINGTSNRASFVNNTTAKGVLALQSTSTSGYSAVELYDNAGTQQGAMGWGNASVAVTGAASATYLYSAGAITFLSGGTSERGRFTAGGDFLVGKQAVDSSVAGCEVQSTGQYVGVRNGLLALFNRLTTDGDLISFRQDGTEEGSISVSGNTVSYNAFAGSHWSQLQDGSKPNILRGTVMESINELCVWPGEQNERLPKSKVSDTAGSKKVYGVFMAWDNDWTETNDMYVTAVGAFICRVNGSVTVQEGDLLESNGDGTARVQADDIIRSSTIGKVTSTVKTHEYDDGSYCVPTVLYCG